MEVEKSNEAIEAIEKSSVPTSSNPSSDTKRVSLDQDTKQRPKEIVKPSTSNVNEAIAQKTDEDQSKSIVEVEESNKAIEKISAPTSSSAKSAITTASNVSKDEMVTDQDIVTDEKTNPDQTSNPPSDTKRRPKEIVKPSTSNVNEAIAQKTDEDQSKSIVEVEESNKAIEKISAPTSSSAKSAITTASNVSKDEMVTDQDIVTDEKINPDQTSNPPSDTKRRPEEMVKPSTSNFNEATAQDTDKMVTDQVMVTDQDDNDEKTTPDQASNPSSDAKRISLDKDTKQRSVEMVEPSNSNVIVATAQDTDDKMVTDQVDNDEKTNPPSDAKWIRFDEDIKQRSKEMVEPSNSNVIVATAQDTDEDQSKSISEVEKSNEAIEKSSVPTLSKS